MGPHNDGKATSNKTLLLFQGLLRPGSMSFNESERTFVMPDDADDERCPKRLRSSEPDVKIVVGDEAFYHYGDVLSYASDFFDALLSSNMKEGTTRAIEFPDKDPEKWKRVAKFFDSAELINLVLANEDLPTLVPWFSELQMKGALVHSDIFLKVAVVEMAKTIRRDWLPKGANADFTGGKKLVKEVLEQAVFSNLYGLPHTMDECLSILKNDVLNGVIDLLPLDAESINNLVIIMKDEAPRTCLFPSIRNLLPDIVPEMEAAEMVHSTLFPGMIALAAQLKSKPAPSPPRFSFGQAPAPDFRFG